MLKKTSAVLASCLALCFGSAVAANVDTYPERPVSLVIPYTPGGLTDALGRLVARELNDKWTQPVVVENRPGGGSTIGTARAAQADPDGLTILKGSVGIVTNPMLMDKLSYDPDSLVPVALVGTAPLVLVVNPSLPVNTVEELKTYQQQVGEVTFASSGNGSSPHITAEMFSAQSGIDILHIPYRGTAPALTDLIGGQVMAAFDTRLTEPYLKTEQLRAIAVASENRLPSLPDLPTFAEAGLPNMQAASWFGYFVPKGTPDDVREKIAADIVEAASKPEVQKQIHDIGLEPTVMGTQEFTEFLKSETERWGSVIREQNITLN